MKHGCRFAVYACVLTSMTFAFLLSAWFVYTLVADGLSAQMMGFEQEPAEGWAHWRWFFFKRSMWGLLGTASIFLVIGALIAWGWAAAIRDFRRT